MRKGVVTKRTWVQPTPGLTGIETGRYEYGPSTPVLVHQFSVDCEFALVEYNGGCLARVAIEELILMPEEPEFDVKNHIRLCVEEGLASFQIMCRDISNQVRR